MSREGMKQGTLGDDRAAQKQMHNTEQQDVRAARSKNNKQIVESDMQTAREGREGQKSSG
jgi:hypothetical protein